jgi:hypothetical protein
MRLATNKPNPKRSALATLRASRWASIHLSSLRSHDLSACIAARRYRGADGHARVAPIVRIPPDRRDTDAQQAVLDPRLTCQVPFPDLRRASTLPCDENVA